MKKRSEKVKALERQRNSPSPPSQRTSLSPPSLLIEHNSSIFKHVPRKPAVPKNAYAPGTARDRAAVDSDADLALVQRRSEIFCSALKIESEVRGFCDDYALFQLSGLTSKSLPRAHRRSKRPFPSGSGGGAKDVPRWLLSVSEQAEIAAAEEAQAAVPISNGRDMLGADFHHNSACKYMGFLPDAEDFDEHKTGAGKGELLSLPNEMLEVVAGHLDSISDLNSLASTCRTMRFMLECWNLREWLPTSMKDPMCAPFPHAVVASRARDLADWTVHGKNEIVPAMARCVPRGCDMPESERRELFGNCLTYGYFGLMELAGLKVGVRLRDLRLFQLRKRELRPLFDFVVSAADRTALCNRPGLPRSSINGVCREIAVVNKYVYCELFHHDVDNLALKWQQQLPTFGAEVRQDWLYYCVPDMDVPQPLACQSMHYGCDRTMLMNFLGDSALAWWNDEMEVAWQVRTEEMMGQGVRVPIHACFSEAAGQALHVIATNTIDIAFPPVGGLELYHAKMKGVDVIACKHEKLDRKIMQLLSFKEHETRLWNPFLGTDRQLIDMADFRGLEHDMWLSVQKE